MQIVPSSSPSLATLARLKNRPSPTSFFYLFFFSPLQISSTILPLYLLIFPIDFFFSILIPYLHIFPLPSTLQSLFLCLCLLCYQVSVGSEVEDPPGCLHI